MSYNPAFVFDESPLAMTNGEQGSNIRLTSFKIFEQNKNSLCPVDNDDDAGAADNNLRGVLMVSPSTLSNSDATNDLDLDESSNNGSDSVPSLNNLSTSSTSAYSMTNVIIKPPTTNGNGKKLPPTPSSSSSQFSPSASSSDSQNMIMATNNDDGEKKQINYKTTSTPTPTPTKATTTKNIRTKKKKLVSANKHYMHPEQNDFNKQQLNNYQYANSNLIQSSDTQHQQQQHYLRQQPQNHSPTSQTSLLAGANANVNSDTEANSNYDSSNHHHHHHHHLHNHQSHNLANNIVSSHHRHHLSTLKPLHNLDDFFVNNNDRTGLCAAVECRDMRYDVGRGSSQKTILYNINVTVPEGSIYGLLGPSGCGKTTMLRCVVGRIIPKEGSVRVFGYRPNDPGSNIPGPAIGYMPQEISVYEDFTIDETLKYFGKICRMKSELLDSRIEFLVNFLDLPEKTRMVSNLSGGQKRRVSLAAALVHSPPLLILDEPTVGVDPLLRQSIWKHLVTLAQTEKISVIITTHYIEEARQANVVGLMRHGKLLAEDSPENLMEQHDMDNLEDVFLKLCVSDSSRQAAKLADLGLPPMSVAPTPEIQPRFGKQIKLFNEQQLARNGNMLQQLDANGIPIKVANDGQRLMAKKPRSFPSLFAITNNGTSNSQQLQQQQQSRDGNDDNVIIRRNHHTNTSDSNDTIQAITGSHNIINNQHLDNQQQQQHINHHQIIPTSIDNNATRPTLTTTIGSNNLGLGAFNQHPSGHHQQSTTELAIKAPPQQVDDDYEFVVNKHNLKSMKPGQKYPPNQGSIYEWTSSLMAVIWKNYISIKRNPPVLVFEFILPAVQVILFCLCIGGDPFDVPVALVNEDSYGAASISFLNSIDKKAIRLVNYVDTDSAIQSVRRGENWGVILIPANYSRFLSERISIDPYSFNSDDVESNVLIKNGTISIYPDLTNLHLALAMENTFRTAFTKFAHDSLETLGLDPALAELPVKVEQPIYGTLKRNGYLEFMAPGVVISITYVMATGLTALAFILEKRDGMLERSLIAGVSTSQILLAHAAIQVFVMTIQIALVLAFTFFVFEIPSNGPFIWVILLILLQGCTGMAFGLLVSAICNEENTAVMMLVGTFYTNLILAGIIWPIEAMPHYLRWLSYIQPQTLPTETLRNILSRGWGISEFGVQIGFAVTIGWLIVFLMAAGFVMQYFRG